MRRLAYTALLVAICAVLAPDVAAGEPAASNYEGVYFYNFENAHFTPKGGSKCWAIKGDMSSAELPGKNGGSPWGTADVKVRGVLGPSGRFGNLGACTRLLTVLEVLEVRNKVQR